MYRTYERNHHGYLPFPLRVALTVLKLNQNYPKYSAHFFKCQYFFMTYLKKRKNSMKLPRCQLSGRVQDDRKRLVINPVFLFVYFQTHLNTCLAAL